MRLKAITLQVIKLRYLAIVVESKEVNQTSKIIKLLQCLAAVGVKHVYRKVRILDSHRC